MADFGYLSEKIGNLFDSALCRQFEKRSVQLPQGRYVSLCFDDFPRSAALTAAPMIERRGWHATWYVAGGFEDRTEPNYGEMFTRSDLVDLYHRGHDIGCHTYDHIDCRTASAAEIESQRLRNLHFLRDRGISDVNSFAFPFGSANIAAKKTMSNSGLALRGVKPGVNQGQIDLNMLRACGLQRNEGGLRTAQDCLKTISQQNGWLIIFTHDVRANPSPWGVTPEAYEVLLDQVSETGAEIVTVGEMVRRLQFDAISDRMPKTKRFEPAA